MAGRRRAPSMSRVATSGIRREAARRSAPGRRVVPGTPAGQRCTMASDQTTTQDPTTQHPQPEQPKQALEHPGREGEMDQQPDYGEESYRGRRRLEGRKALITGG